MNSQIEAIIKAAEGYTGIKESPPNSNNVIFNTRYYGRSVSGAAYPWCMAFIWCLFQDIGAPELFYGGKNTASCTTLMNWAKQQGRFFTNDFRRGDLALFDFDNDKSKSEHVGIIVEVKSGGVVTIEGNTSIGNDSNGGEVMRRTRSNSLIIGVYRPKYVEDKIIEEEEEMLSYDDWKKYMAQYRAELAKGAANLPEYEKAKAQGITDGTRPKDFVTREEAAVMAVRAAK